jgi:hypothetical protein
VCNGGVYPAAILTPCAFVDVSVQLFSTCALVVVSEQLLFPRVQLWLFLSSFFPRVQWWWFLSSFCFHVCNFVVSEQLLITALVVSEQILFQYVNCSCF